MRPRSRLVLALWLACSVLAAEPVVDKAFQPLCAKDAVLCADCQTLNSKLSPYLAVSDPKTPNPTTDQIAGFNQEYNALGDRADVMAAKLKLDGTAEQSIIYPAFRYLRANINAISLNSLPRDLATLSDSLGQQEWELERLQIDAAAGKVPQDDLKKRLRAINEAGTGIWRHLQTTSLNVDRMGHPTQDAMAPDGHRQVILTESGRLAGEANPLQARVAALSRGVQELDKKLGAGLSWPEVDAAAQKKAGEDQAKAKALLKDPFGKNAAAGPPVSGGKITVSASAPTLVDIRRVPAPTAEPAQRPPIYGGRGHEDSDPAESNRVAMMRTFQLTKTVGDPAGRAKYAFQQTGETCGVASQITLLEELGVVPADDKSRKQAEDQLYAMAAKEDYFTGSAADPKRRFHGGTPNQFEGDLLGVPVIKHYAASDDELFKTVSTGKTVLVGVNTGALWNDPKFANGGHFIAITGAEVNRVSGAVLGYYINDTGTNEGARFVTAGQFLNAWHKHARVFVEPQ